MTAAAWTRPGYARSCLRPVDYRRDLAAVADLIERTFSGRLDAAGRRMLREMRLYGQAGWLGWLIGWLVLPKMAYGLGFVWEEDGRVVGNASLMRVEGYPARYVLANVAVDPGYRRRGIARRMAEASIELAHRRGGTVIVLQVDSRSEGAQGLYASLGFRALTTRTTWERLPDWNLPLSAEVEPARRRQPSEWRQEWSLVSRVHPEGLVWPFPLEPGLLRPGAMEDALGLDAAGNWVWQREGLVAAFLIGRPAGERKCLRMNMVVEPEAQGRAEAPLLQQALADLGPGRKRVLLEYLAGKAQAELQGLGFRPQRTLAWMALDLMSGDVA